MTTSAKAKKRELRQVMYALAAIFLIIGISLAAAWSIRGTRHDDFCGIGQAQILNIRSEQRTGRQSIETRFHFTLHVTAGTSVFDCEETRESTNGWREGTVLPIVYNVTNPKEFVLDMSQDELNRWDNVLGRIAVIVLLIGFVCLFIGIKTRQPSRKSLNSDPYQPYDRE